MNWVDSKTDTEKLTELCIEICMALGTVTSPPLNSAALAIIAKLEAIKVEQTVQRGKKKLKLKDLEAAVKQINDII